MLRQIDLFGFGRSPGLTARDVRSGCRCGRRYSACRGGLAQAYSGLIPVRELHTGSFESSSNPGLVQAIDGLSERVVVRVADTADRRLDAGFCQALLGGLKWWSQHSAEGGCDEDPKTAFGSGWSGTIAVTRSTLGGRTR